MTKSVARAAIRHCRASAWSIVLICGIAAAARAEVHIEGNPDAVRVTTSRDAIGDVLTAFAATFNVKYRTAVALDATAGVTYAGSFGQVMSRLLDGYNYVIKREDGAIEVVVFGRRGEVAIPPPAPKPPPFKGIVSQWK